MVDAGTTIINEELRYERKYLITDFSFREVEQWIKFHPAAFSEIYYPRTINNIYFDTLGFSNYYDNVEGETKRLKVRIRWYGELNGTIQQPMLEYKIKEGLLGKKESYPLLPFQLNEQLERSAIISALQPCPLIVKNFVAGLQPVLLNRYRRRYFLSADKHFRITVDHDLSYYSIGYDRPLLWNPSVDRNSTVVELKYDSNRESEAKAIGSALPFPLTKNSKYLQGLERVVF